ncbi:MAG TPA: hypothetical protein VF926_15390 [Mycobacterium sp.]|jgi:hypothetical protein
MSSSSTSATGSPLKTTAAQIFSVGIVERVPVYSILAWQFFSAVLLLTRPAGRDDG